MSRINTRELVYGALFTAIAVLLNFMAIYIGPTIKISLAPAIVIFAGSLLGPLVGALVGALSDILVMLIKAVPGGFFPGFTLTMALYGILGALFLNSRKERPSLARTIGSTIAIQCICSLLLNTWWTTMTTGNPFGVLMLARAPLTFTASAFYIVILFVLYRYQTKIFRKIKPA